MEFVFQGEKTMIPYKEFDFLFNEITIPHRELDFQGKKNGGIFPDWYLRVSGNQIPGRELLFH